LKPSLRVCVFKAHDRKAETTEPLRRRQSGKGSAVLETPPFDRNHRPARLANEAIAWRSRRSMSLLEKNVAAATLVGGQQNSLSPRSRGSLRDLRSVVAPHMRRAILLFHGKAGFFIYLYAKAGFFIYSRRRSVDVEILQSSENCNVWEDGTCCNAASWKGAPGGA
jgi:hypothetical protein